mmetsp:Transcript_76616/g.164289  ORF Transcript_76616/g.164289 Transcript_76616/m.164289 type:complete len:239 (-) Transcript_76616:793-1509(-)
MLQAGSASTGHWLSGLLGELRSRSMCTSSFSMMRGVLRSNHCGVPMSSTLLAAAMSNRLLPASRCASPLTSCAPLSKAASTSLSSSRAALAAAAAAFPGRIGTTVRFKGVVITPVSRSASKAAAASAATAAIAVPSLSPLVAAFRRSARFAHALTTAVNSGTSPLVARASTASLTILRGQSSRAEGKERVQKSSPASGRGDNPKLRRRQGLAALAMVGVPPGLSTLLAAMLVERKPTA